MFILSFSDRSWRKNRDSFWVLVMNWSSQSGSFWLRQEWAYKAENHQHFKSGSKVSSLHILTSLLHAACRHSYVADSKLNIQSGTGKQIHKDIKAAVMEKSKFKLKNLSEKMVFLWLGVKVFFFKKIFLEKSNYDIWLFGNGLNWFGDLKDEMHFW